MTQPACTCGWPIAHTTADVYVTGRRKTNGCYTIDRWVDCIVHGVGVIRMETTRQPPRDPPAWTNHRATVLVAPCRPLGAT